MRQLDYRPNSQARALVTGRSRTRRRDHLRHDALRAGLDARQHRPRRARRGLLRQRRQRRDARSLRRSSGRASGCATLGVDGILVIAPHVAATSALWDLPSDLPVVAVEAGPDEGVPVVAVDQYQGARLATEHLLALGHATVHHIAGPADWIEAQRRVDGWRDALEAAGARGSTPLQGDWSPRSGYDARAPAARARRRHGGLRGQRPDGARPAALPQRARSRRARRRQRDRLRRHPRGRVLHARR